ncbi:GNAT family N-acetyltransferase [Actinomycetospora lemnae]|uniref:GNAT family N-acetyltransferase n=1 Tax=Actinomycetospora lemnae TaxID=3019891 RepID=A0ABT5SPP7_9PSEU|nr:GNAT family N-acetyltransferase [Actinomycetospora sp. DW7H6]MDD7964808.1 GNAT family N-acetyltransferase [Actinomycetospora sp. DW7H6]
MPRAPIAVSRARAAPDWRAAAVLLDEYRRWLADAVAIDLTVAQPRASTEFSDLERYYRPPEGVLVVASVGGRPAGMAGVHRLAGAVGELKRMYVRPSARGRGVGRALLVEAIAAARDLGFVELRLQTKPTVMAVADRLYREHGFVDIEPYADLGVEGVADLALALRADATGR